MKPSELPKRISDTGIASEGMSGNCRITVEAGPELLALARAYLRLREDVLGIRRGYYGIDQTLDNLVDTALEETDAMD